MFTEKHKNARLINPSNETEKPTLPEEYATFLGDIFHNTISVEDIPDDKNEVLAQVMGHQLIQVLNDGTLSLTEKGMYALNKRILMVYPLTQNNSAKGYNNTLKSQTSGGKDAFLAALSTEASKGYFNEVNSSRISRMFEAFTRANLVPRLNLRSLTTLTDTSVRVMTEKLQTNPSVYAHWLGEMLEYLTAELDGLLYTTIKSSVVDGKYSLKVPILDDFRDYKSVVSKDDVLYLEYVDKTTGDRFETELLSSPTELKFTILSQLDL